MVVFTCSYCGESLKKPSVSKHYKTKCRHQSPFVTCVDCLKDFRGYDYVAHIKCFTEEERYSAKGFVPKPSSNKGSSPTVGKLNVCKFQQEMKQNEYAVTGERKQKAWSDCFQGVLSKGNLRSDEKTFLEGIVVYSNIPRNKIKFMNFLNNSFKYYATKTELVDRVWAKVEAYFNEIKQAKPAENTLTQQMSEQSNVNNEKEEECKNKRKVDEISNDDDNGDRGAEKKKKKKLCSETDMKNVSDNEVDAVEKIKKKKKSKSNENEPPEIYEMDMEATTTNQKIKMEAEASGVKTEKKKKKKKDKCEELQQNGTIIGAGGPEDMVKTSSSDIKSEKKKKKKPYCEEELHQNGETIKGKEQTENGESESFSWSETILNALQKNNGEMSLKELEKKVLKKYKKTFNCEVIDKLTKKFAKKLHKMVGITVNDELVILNK